jgi:Holliday junction DNA helicase RuvA
MIGRLSGRILTARPEEVVLDVAGVGYRVQIPLSTFYRLAEGGGHASLHVHTHVREDAIQLFGFWSEEERTAFERLIAVSGIGPKIALAVLSGVGAEGLQRAIKEDDRSVLERIPGIGRKTAERVLLELRERPAARRRGRNIHAPDHGPTTGSPAERGMDADAVSALVHLGYPEGTASDAVRQARRDSGPDASLEMLLRSALRALVR